MSKKNARRALGAVTLLALALPTAAAAHPTVYDTTAITAVAKEVQTLTITGAPTGGTFLPNTGAVAVDFDATAAEVDASLEAQFAGVVVTGAEGGPFTVTFPTVGTDVVALVPNGAALTGGTSSNVAAATTTNGRTNEVRYMIAQHGFPLILKESNADTTDGMISYASYPSAIRTGKTMVQKLSAWPDAVTGVQPHAQCSVASLNDPNVIAQWQASESDPFYGYIPFQKDAVGIDDDPADWIAIVKAASGVDLATISTAAAAQTACTGIGGTYIPADLPASGSVNVIGAVAGGAANGVLTGWAKATVDAATAAAIAPKDASIATLTKEKADLMGVNTALDAAKKAAETALADEKDRDVNVTRGSNVLDTTEVYAMVTGDAGAKVTVKLTVTFATKRKLGLASTTLGAVNTKFDAEGAKLVTIPLSRTVRNKIAASRGDVAVSFTATSGADSDSAAAKLDS